MTAGTEETGGAFLRESRRIGVNLAAMVAARCACLALTFVQLGVIYRALGVEGSGQFGFALGYSALFTAFATLGIHRLLIRDIARDPATAWTCVWTATAVVAALSVLVIGVIALSIFALEQRAVVRGAVLLAAASVVVLWALQCPFEALLTARERLGRVAIAYAVGGALKLGSVYVALQWIPTSAAAHGAIAVANLLAFALCVVFAVQVGGWERPRVRLALAIRQVRECVPLLMAMVCSLVYFKSDISILKFLRDDRIVGIYTVPQRVTEPIMMLSNVVGTVIFPALCRLAVEAEGTYDALKKTSLRFALLIAFPMAFGLGFLADPVVGLFTGARYAEFVGSVRVLQLLCVAIPLFYVNGIGLEFFYATHQNWFVVRVYAAAAVVSVLGNLWAVPRFGAHGAAGVAILVNLLVAVVFLWKLRADLGPMRLVSLTVKTTLACTLMGLVAASVARVSLVAAIGSGVILYPVLQVLLRTLDADERELAERAVRVPLAWVRKGP